MSIVTFANIPAEPANPNHRFYTYEEYMALPRETTPWLIENLIPVGGLVNMFGKPKAGKSFGALGIAYAIADESQPYWLDPSFKVTKHGKVMYLQVDTPRPAWMARLDLIKARHNYDTKGNLLFADTGSAPYPFDIMSSGNHLWLQQQVAANAPDLVILDVLREIHSGDEDSSTAMRNVMGRIVSACKPAAVMLVSHSRKGMRESDGNAHDDIMDAARGSSYVAGRMDMVIRLTDRTLYTKGRACMDGKFPVIQEPGTGLLLPNYGVHEIEMEEVMKGLNLTPSKDEADKLRLLRVLYPDASVSTIRGRMNRLRGKAIEPPDPKKMRYTMADIADMVKRVEEGKHPTEEAPMPKVTISESKERKKKGVDNDPGPVVG